MNQRSVLQFTANIKNGTIEIPREYLEILQDTDTVNITLTPQPKTAAVGIIAELIKNPLEVQDFVPLTRDQAHERE